MFKIINNCVAIFSSFWYNQIVMKSLENIFEIEYTPMEARQLNPLVLAFVGDSFFSFYITTNKLKLEACKVKGLNSNLASFVNAKAQEEYLFKIMNCLTEEENDIVHRGRNANIKTKAKNFSIEEYRHATGFEALLGYLYLSKNYDRLIELLNKIF